MVFLPRNHQGFTLIEILVVITIIGILSGLIVINVVTSDPQKDLNREGERLMAVLEMAQEEALFGRQDIGVVVTEQGYSFARYGLPDVVEPELDPAATDTQQQAVTSQLLAAAAPKQIDPVWMAIADDNALRPYELSEDYEIVLEVDEQLIDPTGGKKVDPNNPVTEEEAILPAIYISPSGEMTPFVLEIYLKDDSDIMVKVSGDDTGRLWMGDDES